MAFPLFCAGLLAVFFAAGTDLADPDRRGDHRRDPVDHSASLCLVLPPRPPGRNQRRPGRHARHAQHVPLGRHVDLRQPRPRREKPRRLSRPWPKSCKSSVGKPTSAACESPWPTWPPASIRRKSGRSPRCWPRGDQLGTSMSGSLLDQADHFRTARKQLATLQANRMPVFLTFPLALLLCPGRAHHPDVAVDDAVVRLPQSGEPGRQPAGQQPNAQHRGTFRNRSAT